MVFGFFPLTFFDWQDMVRLFIKMILLNNGEDFVKKETLIFFMSNKFDNKKTFQ